MWVWKAVSKFIRNLLCLLLLCSFAIEAENVSVVKEKQDAHESKAVPELVSDEITQEALAEEQRDSSGESVPFDVESTVKTQTSVDPKSSEDDPLLSSSDEEGRLENDEQRAPASKRSRRGKRRLRQLGVRKKRFVVPKSKSPIRRIERRAMRVAEPPRQFRKYFETGTDEAELESVINQEINQLFNLLKTTKRRDLRLRLGSLYVEKARLIEYRLYEEYDRRMEMFNKGQLKRKPRINLRPTFVYTNKAITLFETYRQQFPRDKNMDQVLFFLGVSYFKKGQLTRGKNYYETLVKRFPRSEYITDVNFELGEYYFNKSNWRKSVQYYRRVVSKRDYRLYSFSMYKIAWCRFKLGQISRAMANLAAVIREGARQKNKRNMGVQGAGSVHFANEALGDLALFYSRSRRSPSQALSYFETMSGDSTRALKMLKDLAYAYLDQGKLAGLRITFKKLIEEDRYSPLAYEYQYQIVRAHTHAGGRKSFLTQLRSWLVNYGPNSSWVSRNRDNNELLKKSSTLMEATVRNYSLRMHKSFRKTKDTISKNQALAGYSLYNEHFRNSRLADQMHFFYAELLFDLRQYSAAAKQYLYVVNNFKKSQYYEVSSLNSVLALEKNLPSPKRINQLVRKRKDVVPFPRSVLDFQKQASYYVQRFPKKPNVPAILYKAASLQYEFNHHTEALKQFWSLIEKYPSSKYTEYSGNLILDIYNVRKDFEGLKNAIVRLLGNKVIAKSPSAPEMRKILSQVSLRSAENLAKNKQYFESGTMYKTFADSHPQSPLRGVAYYNAAVNFKKSGDKLKAISLYTVVLGMKSSRGGLKHSTRKSILKEIPTLYQETGQYMKAASSFLSYARTYPRDPEAADFWFNAALVYDGFNRYSQAEQAYLNYFRKSRKQEKSQALYLLGELRRRRGHPTKAISYYNQFLNRGGNSPLLTEAAFKIAEIKRARGQRTESKKWYRKTVNIYKKNQSGVFYAAQAQFNLVYDTYLKLRKIKIPANPKRQQQAMQSQLKLFNKLKSDLADVLRFDSGHQVVASLTLIGLAAEYLGDSIFYSPLPKGLNKQEIAQYKEGLRKAASPFKSDAIKNYQMAVDRSRKLKSYNKEWLRRAVQRLSFFDKAPIDTKPLLRKQTFPVMLSDWSGR